MATKTYPIHSPIRLKGKTVKDGFVDLEDNVAKPLQATDAIGEAVILPPDFPAQKKLLAAGIETQEAAQRAIDSGELKGVDGIGKATFKEITEALGSSEEDDS